VPFGIRRIGLVGAKPAQEVEIKRGLAGDVAARAPRSRFELPRRSRSLLLRRTSGTATPIESHTCRCLTKSLSSGGVRQESWGWQEWPESVVSPTAPARPGPAASALCDVYRRIRPRKPRPISGLRGPHRSASRPVLSGVARELQSLSREDLLRTKEDPPSARASGQRELDGGSRPVCGEHLAGRGLRDPEIGPSQAGQAGGESIGRWLTQCTLTHMSARQIAILNQAGRGLLLEQATVASPGPIGLIWS
jgi:hypothetical protein